MKNLLFDLTLEEQQGIYGGTAVIIGYKFEKGGWVPVYA